MKQLILTVLFGLVFSIPTITPQTSGFSQIGKPGQELGGGGNFIAHPSLPLNSKAKIVNTSTGKELEVTIIRHIPASPHRIADISHSVWQKLELTPDTDIRIYTTAAGRPLVKKPRVATPAPAPAAPPAPPTPDPEVVLDNVYNNGYLAGYYDGYDDGYYIESYRQTTAKAAKPAPVVETRQQQPQPAKASDTWAQPAQPAVSDIWALVAMPPALTAPPAAVSETRTQQAQPAPVVETRQQQVPPAAPVVETRGAAQVQTIVINDPWLQGAKPVVIVDNSPYQPVIAAETRPQATQPAQSAETQPQTAQPAQSVETRQQQALSDPFADAWTEVTKSIVLNEPRPQAARPVVVVEQPSQPAITVETRTQTVPVVNDVLITPALPDPNSGKTYLLQVGAFTTTDTAAEIARELDSSGFKVAYENAGSLHRIFVRDVPAAMVYDTAQSLKAFGIEQVWVRE